MNNNSDELRKCLLQYSLDDLLSSFLVLNLWLPNIASPIKIQYLYVVLEFLQRELPQDNKINSYEDFESACKSIIKFLPSFSMLEDYIPEADWGEIKYFYDDKIYKIFYGADLSNPYDYYYSFEIIHRQFKDYYTRVINCSVLGEFEFCLGLQNYLLENIKQTKAQELEINPGNFGIPSKDFWEEVNKFLDQFNPEELFDHGFISKYTRDFSTEEPLLLPDLEEFGELAHSGKNCPYYFIKNNGKYYPIMPRRYFSILYDTWGTILKQHYKQIQIEFKNPEIDIGIELFKFIRDRVSNDNLFGLVSPMDGDQPYQMTFTAAIHSKNRLFLIHTTPPSIDDNVLNSYLEKITPELKESIRFASTYPTRLVLWVQKKMIEFKSKNEGESLIPTILTVIPYGTTEDVFIKFPKDFPARAIGLDQLVGIIDEIEDSDELSEYFDYIESLQSSFMSPVTSYLDKYGSFKDSHGVLVPGAREYNSIVIDWNWGSDYRYLSLSKFWQKFPEMNIFGHPRSWKIPEKSKNIKSAIFQSRTFFGYVYYQEVGLTSFLINSPIDRMSYEQGKITDLMIQTIYDALGAYEKTLNELDFTRRKNKIQILISPASLVSKCTGFDHLKHLIPHTGLWLMDISRLDHRDYGIRVVFDDKLIFSTLENTKDRSIQINFLLDILEQMNIRLNETKLSCIKQQLEQEKGNKIRIKLFSMKKNISFPELTKTALPEEKDWKIADKTVAQLANGIGIKPGKYKQEEAKVILNKLRGELVKRINIDVSKFNIEQSIPLLLEKIDALANEHFMKKTRVEESFDQEVEYERENKISEDNLEFLGHHQNYRGSSPKSVGKY